MISIYYLFEISINDKLNIICKHNDKDELKVKNLVEDVYKKYKFPKYTYDIIIDKTCIPYSHPLTINIRALTEKIPEMYLLSLLIHENQHYFTKSKLNKQKFEFLSKEYENLYDDKMKKEFRDNYTSFIVHISVCFNTMNIVKQLSSKNFKYTFEEIHQPYENMTKYINSNFDGVKIFLSKLDLIDKIKG